MFLLSYPHHQGGQSNVREEVSTEDLDIGFDLNIALAQSESRQPDLTLANVQPASFSLYSTEMLFLEVTVLLLLYKSLVTDVLFRKWTQIQDYKMSYVVIFGGYVSSKASTGLYNDEDIFSGPKDSLRRSCL